MNYKKQHDELVNEIKFHVNQASSARYYNNKRACIEEAESYKKAAEAAKKLSTISMQNPELRKKYDEMYARYKKMEDDVLTELEREFEIEDEIYDEDIPLDSPVSDSSPKKKTPVSSKSNDTEKKGTYVTTESGFRTKNTVGKYVTAEMIESWHQEQPKQRLKTYNGNAKLKNMMMNIVNKVDMKQTQEALKVNFNSCPLLYGPPGSGKSEFIKSFAGEMMDRGYNFLMLTGSQIHQGLVGASEKVISAMFAEAIDSAPCVLYIDEFELVCKDRAGKKTESHEQNLSGEFLRQYDKLHDSSAPVFIMTATNHPLSVDSAMRSRLAAIPIPLPSEEERKTYFEDKFSMCKLADDITFENMADWTDNFSYRDLDFKLRMNIINYLLDNQLIKLGLFDENGIVTDPELADKLLAENAANKNYILTKDIFLKALKESPLDNYYEICAELNAFEESKPQSMVNFEFYED